jgi:hypothetical protein
VLSTAFFISAAIDLTVSGSTGTITAIVEAAAGIISLAYWGLAQPQNLRGSRPLGIAILAAENLILGIILALSGVVLLFLPVIGIIGAAIAAVGIGLAYLGRGLWNGREWALTIETIVTVIQIISAFAALAFRLGNPTLTVVQLWYLRRPNVQEFFETQDSTTLWSGRVSRPQLRSEKTCMVCGARNPGSNANCSNCGLSIFSDSDGIPFAGAVETERIVRLKLERVQDELRVMDRIKQENKIVDSSIFEKAHSEREFENRRLKAKLDTITSTPSAS